MSYSPEIVSSSVEQAISSAASELIGDRCDGESGVGVMKGVVLGVVGTPNVLAELPCVGGGVASIDKLAGKTRSSSKLNGLFHRIYLELFAFAVAVPNIAFACSTTFELVASYSTQHSPKPDY